MSQKNHGQPQPPNIDLQIDPEFRARVPLQRIVQVVEATLRHGGVSHGEVTLVVAGDDLLQQLNHTYREIDAPTDVLSFPAHDDTEDQPPFVSAPEALNYLGDVVISFPTAERQAGAAGHSVADELCLLAVHGVLHLLGYDHTSAEEEADMWARQAQILASLPTTI